MYRSEKVFNYAAAFATVSAGVLMLSFVPSVLGLRGVQKMQKLTLAADANRMMSLAKTYDTKAAVEALKELSKINV